MNADLDFDTDRDGDVDSDDDYWNNGAGWVPIGDSFASFSSFGAIFEGNGRTITNLFIDSSENDIGLFGATRSSAIIRNLEMVSVQVTGTENVGGLVGSNGGAVSGSFATGKVSGDDDVGGLVGANLEDGSVSASYSTVQVAGDDRVGGLAGFNRGGEVTAAYATGRIVGDFEVGGLIGRNSGDVNISYATGLVSGRSTIGGLVGRNRRRHHHRQLLGFRHVGAHHRLLRSSKDHGGVAAAHGRQRHLFEPGTWTWTATA